MGLLFFPRGGSAQVARYLAVALGDAGWSVPLVAGSLGAPGEDTHAPTFFGGLDLHYLDYTAAVARLRRGRQRRGGAGADAPLVRGPRRRARRGAGRRRPGAGRSPGLGVGGTVGGGRGGRGRRVPPPPPHAPARRRRPSLAPRTGGRPPARHRAQVHRGRRRAGGRRPPPSGTTLAAMPDAVAGRARSTPTASTRRQLETAAHDPLGAVAPRRVLGRAPPPPGRRRRPPRRRVALRPGHRHLGARRRPPDRVTDVPNGVDTDRFHPGTSTPAERRALFRRWLVEDPQGWDESGVPGFARLPGGRPRPAPRHDGDDHGARLRRPVHGSQAGAAARRGVRPGPRPGPPPGSLLVWGGHPGEWEGEHPVTVARRVGPDGVSLRRLAGPRRPPRRPGRLRRAGHAVGQRLLPADPAGGHGRRAPGARHPQRRLPVDDQPRPQRARPAGSPRPTTSTPSPTRSWTPSNAPTSASDAAPQPSPTPARTCRGPGGWPGSSTPTPWRTNATRPVTGDPTGSSCSASARRRRPCSSASSRGEEPSGVLGRLG